MPVVGGGRRVRIRASSSSQVRGKCSTIPSPFCSPPPTKPSSIPLIPIFPLSFLSPSLNNIFPTAATACNDET
jgi:hypothetical protein